LHAGGILFGTEDGDATVGEFSRGSLAIGLHALVGLLAIVEAGSEAVDGDVRGGDEGGRRPLRAGGVGEVGFDMAVY
jgi:hypothetical protein